MPLRKSFNALQAVRYDLRKWAKVVHATGQYIKNRSHWPCRYRAGIPPPVTREVLTP